MSSTKACPEIKYDIWRQTALHAKMKDIERYLGLHQTEYPEPLPSKYTIARVQKELLSLPPETAVLILRRLPEIRGYVLEKRPELKAELKHLGLEPSQLTNDEIIAKIAELFDRPAFCTPFQQEHWIPSFEKAIDDTIEALNTGARCTTRGRKLRRVPTRHELKGAAAKKTFAGIVDTLVKLRAKFDYHLQNGGIQQMVKDPDRSGYLISSVAASDMDRLRRKILKDFKGIYPDFLVELPRYRWKGAIGSKAVHPMGFRGQVINIPRPKKSHKMSKMG